MWCVVVCDLENLKNEEVMTRVGSQRHKQNRMYPAAVCVSSVLQFTARFTKIMYK